MRISTPLNVFLVLTISLLTSPPFLHGQLGAGDFKKRDYSKDDRRWIVTKKTDCFHYRDHFSYSVNEFDYKQTSKPGFVLFEFEVNVDNPSVYVSRKEFLSLRKEFRHQIRIAAPPYFEVRMEPARGISATGNIRYDFSKYWGTIAIPDQVPDGEYEVSIYLAHQDRRVILEPDPTHECHKAFRLKIEVHTLTIPSR